VGFSPEGYSKSQSWINNPFNEDDHEVFDQPTKNLVAAVGEHVFWGWFDWRRKGEGFGEGCQCVPVNWGISSARKRAFFEKVAEVTGAAKP
jgi:hypothetical protein